MTKFEVLQLKTFKHYFDIKFSNNAFKEHQYLKVARFKTDLLNL